ncbi:MAG: 50S ribosomal protein L23 [Candidatus Nanoperiomorbaceae bacterium]
MNILVTPHISEKSYGLSNQKTYVFDVPLTANKKQVRDAVLTNYPTVKVSDVRLVIAKGKAKAVNRGKYARPTLTKRKNTKKAYVSVSEGEIKVFSESEEA